MMADVSSVAPGHYHHLRRGAAAPTPPPLRLASRGKDRVFFLDVNSLCYDGARHSLHAFARWLSLFFDQVSARDPVVAVLDGEGGNEYRRRLLPSYKAHRRKSSRGRGGSVNYAEELVVDVLKNCSVPVSITVGGEL